jgi:hypothetical protein
MAVYPETVNDFELKCSSIPYSCPFCFVEEGQIRQEACVLRCVKTEKDTHNGDHFALKSLTVLKPRKEIPWMIA